VSVQGQICSTRSPAHTRVRDLKQHVLSCRSRIGKGDLGVNATRIRQFLQNLDDELADDS
jgi:hypothetical protein